VFVDGLVGLLHSLGICMKAVRLPRLPRHIIPVTGRQA
jgi:hypothetical protein